MRLGITNARSSTRCLGDVGVEGGGRCLMFAERSTSAVFLCPQRLRKFGLWIRCCGYSRYVNVAPKPTNIRNNAGPFEYHLHVLLCIRANQRTNAFACRNFHTYQFPRYSWLASQDYPTTSDIESADTQVVQQHIPQVWSGHPRHKPSFVAARMCWRVICHHDSFTVAPSGAPAPKAYFVNRVGCSRPEVTQRPI